MLLQCSFPARHFLYLAVSSSDADFLHRVLPRDCRFLAWWAGTLTLAFGDPPKTTGEMRKSAIKLWGHIPNRYSSQMGVEREPKSGEQRH